MRLPGFDSRDQYVTICNHTGGVDEIGPPQATTALAGTTEGGGGAMAERTLTITLTPGEPVTGLWCDRCALPSRIEIPLHMLTDHGVTTLKTVAYCDEHGRD